VSTIQPRCWIDSCLTHRATLSIS